MAKRKSNHVAQDEGPHWSTLRSLTAERAIFQAGETTWGLMGRNLGGDWGEASPEQVLANEASLKTDTPHVLSVFRTSLDDEIREVTDFEAHRTEILLASEYFKVP